MVHGIHAFTDGRTRKQKGHAATGVVDSSNPDNEFKAGYTQDKEQTEYYKKETKYMNHLPLQFHSVASNHQYWNLDILYEDACDSWTF